MDKTERKSELAAVRELVAAAKEYVRRTLGVDLDLSAESLPVVDHYLKETPFLEPSVQELVIAAFGIYFGEVARLRFDGEWMKEATKNNPSSWKMELAEGALSFFPTGVVAEAIKKGPVEGWDGDIDVPRYAVSKLKERLDRLGPVEEKHYYSLVGRIEALESLVEGLKEIKREKN